MNTTYNPLNWTSAAAPAAAKAPATTVGSKLAQSAVILAVGVAAACARLLTSSPPRLPWCGEKRHFQPKYVIAEAAVLIVTAVTALSSAIVSGEDRKLLLQAIPVVAAPYVVALNAAMHGRWWKGLGDGTVQVTTISVGTATRRGLTYSAQSLLLVLTAAGIALQAFLSDPVQAALNLVAFVTLQFGVHVNALQPASSQEGTSLAKATIPTPCIGFKTRGYGIADGQLWQVPLVASQWSILAPWKDKLPKLRYLAAKGDFLAFVSEYTPLIQEAAERDGEGIAYDKACASDDLARWLEALVMAEAEKISRDMGTDAENPGRARPCIDVWYALAVLERIAFKSDTIMHKPLPAAGEPPATFAHHTLRKLCTYHNPAALEALTNEDGLLTLQDALPPAFLASLAAADEKTAAALERARAAYRVYPRGKWPPEAELPAEQRREALALAKAYTSSIPCVMLTVLEFLWVREGESGDRRAGREKKGLAASAEDARVKQCLLGQIVATQAVGMFYGAAVILGTTIFKGNGLSG